MRILITGAEGQLGHELQCCLKAMRGEIGPLPSEYVGAIVDLVDRGDLDIADSQAVVDWFESHDKYDLVVNAAAVTNVDGCESNEAGAYEVNAHGAQNLAKACSSTGAKIVHVSTDYVFSGDDPRPRNEEDRIGPISAYGRTKWAGEVLVRAACERHFIIRTAWLYGYVGGNFVKTMRRLGSQRDEVSVVDDQLGNPTSANDLAYEILKIALTDEFGTYHCTSEGTCSWADFAKAIMEGSDLACKVVPVSSAEYRRMNPRSAERPAFSSLSNERLAQTVGNEMRTWREALAAYLGNLSDLEDAHV